MCLPLSTAQLGSKLLFLSGTRVTSWGGSVTVQLCFMFLCMHLNSISTVLFPLLLLSFTVSVTLLTTQTHMKNLGLEFSNQRISLLTTIAFVCGKNRMV